ncbi:type VII toxin-antitoxin system MntA family adenylyltransferase antitoxin [Halosimplex marinum]|uniref:type VII toxin-antitoxin system MntA family adenylyltransferase antitoxin n=1 Tax=Halosimplex marinum TaxID=3396620 RepID=UPI003F5585C6
MASADVPDTDAVDFEGIRDYLETTAVEFAVVFGSHVRGTAEVDSDLDILLRFPEDFDDGERFRARNRIDAALQQYASGFVDVSDAESLPTRVLYAALGDGAVLVGDDASVERYRERVEREYEETADERERERRAVIDRLAGGET